MDLGDLGKVDTESIKKSLDDLETDFGDPEGEAWNDLEAEVDKGVEEAGLDPDDTGDSVGEDTTLEDLLLGPLEDDGTPPVEPPQEGQPWSDYYIDQLTGGNGAKKGPKLDVDVPAPLPKEK